MAFSGMGSGGGRGRGRWRSGGAMSEMNVVPLVDVVLVLLIIFMVTASAMEFGLEIDVPKVKTASRSVEDAPVVSIDNTSRVFLLEKPTNINQLGAAIQRQFPKAKDVYLRSDKNVKVDQLMQVVGALAEAKLNVKLVTRSENIKK
jgi:biopolymer transport protein ExbD